MRKSLLFTALLSISLPAVAQDLSQQPPPPDAMTGVRPMRNQVRQAAPRAATRTQAAARPASQGPGTQAELTGDREYTGGAGSPLSTTAANTTSANTRSGIAPRLPDPNAASSTPEAYLAAARNALAQGKTGMAQEALERAETRILSRSTDPSMAATPADMPLIQQIGAARQALANRDTRGAQAAIGAALGEPAGTTMAEPPMRRRTAPR